MKAIRIFIRSIRDSFRSVFRNFSLSVASIACTTITLILVAVAMVLSYNVKTNTQKLEGELSIVVYVNKETTQEQIVSLKSQMENLTNVKEVVYKSKDDWKQEMGESSSSLETVLNGLEENPLLDSFVVTVSNVKELKDTCETISLMENVKSAEYGEGMAEKIIRIFDLIQNVAYGIVIGLVLVTMFLISNTIKLTIFSRKSEIEIMRLVGTSNTAIKLPFLFEGFIIGCIGSIIPIILLIYGYIILYQKTGGFILTEMITLVSPYYFIFKVALIILAIGCLVGMFASFRAVRKYLKI